jgi:superfamily II DNA or RNA helicase
VVATGRLVGEGFDHPPLDTLLLAMPVSWRGTLQQYAGRLHRQRAGKTSVRIIDWLDLGHPIMQRVWDRRLRGYWAMGYALQSRDAPIGFGNEEPQRPPISNTTGVQLSSSGKALAATDSPS